MARYAWTSRRRKRTPPPRSARLARQAVQLIAAAGELALRAVRAVLALDREQPRRDAAQHVWRPLECVFHRAGLEREARAIELQHADLAVQRLGALELDQDTLDGIELVHARAQIEHQAQHVLAQRAASTWSSSRLVTVATSQV